MHGSIFFALNTENGKAPTRVQLLPAGAKIMGRDGRNWSNHDPAQVVLNTQARKIDLPIDENHALHLKAPLGESSPAFGWMRNITLNAQGETWADVEWTDAGRQLVESRQYRYLSPVFTFDKDTGDVIAIQSASFSNLPNLELAALNTQTQPSGNAAGQQEESMKKILAALGLPETATEDQALAALNAVQAKANSTALNSQVDLSLYAPRADMRVMEERALNAEKQLIDRNAADLKIRAEAAVDGAIKERKIAPVSKPAYLAMCASEEGLKQFGEVMKSTPALNQEGAGPHGMPPAGDVALKAEDAEMAKAFGYSVEQWKKLKEGSK